MTLPYEHYISLLGALDTLDKPATRIEVHKKSETYKQVASTTQALNRLVKLGYATRKDIGCRQFSYSILHPGRALLKLKEKTQFKHLARKEHLMEQGEVCCMCDARENLTLFKRKLHCPEHLNRDFVKPELQIRTAGALEFA